MERLTSTTNQTVKNTASLSLKKFRDETKTFLAEGEKAIKGLYDTGFELLELFVFENDVEKYKSLKSQKLYVVNEAVISKISTTKTPCEAVAVFRQKSYNSDLLFKSKKVLLLENIKDAGNLGTILRSCKAFNVDSVALLGDTIDLYNPKVVRSSVGCFDLPVIKIDYSDLELFKEFNIYSTALYDNSMPLKSVKFETPMMIAFGAEADGLTKEFLKIVSKNKKSKNVNIEMKNDVESLNLATAVSICLYEVFVK